SSSSFLACCPATFPVPVCSWFWLHCGQPGDRGFSSDQPGRLASESTADNKSALRRRDRKLFLTGCRRNACFMAIASIFIVGSMVVQFCLQLSRVGRTFPARHSENRDPWRNDDSGKNRLGASNETLAPRKGPLCNRRLDLLFLLKILTRGIRHGHQH